MSDIYITIGGAAAVGKTSLAHLIKCSLRSYGVDVEILGNDERRQDLTGDELAQRLIALRGKTVQVLEVRTEREPT